MNDDTSPSTGSQASADTMRQARHDLRGSLNVVSLHVSLLRRTVQGEREAGWLDEIDKEVRRMEQAVDALRASGAGAATGDST